MIEVLSQGWFGSVVGILGLFVGVIGLVLYLRSRIGARPMCFFKTLRLIGKSEQELPQEIDVLFEGVSVPRLSLTHVYIWNGGQETVHGTQVVQDDAIRCEFPPSDHGNMILKAHIAKETRSVNKFAVKVPQERKNEVIFSFDFLDPGDGARIEILHTSPEKYPRVLGTIKGIPHGVRLLSGPSTSSITRAFRILRVNPQILYITLLVVGIAMLVTGLLSSETLRKLAELLDNTANSNSNTIYALRSSLLITGGLYTLLPLFILQTRRKKYPSVLDQDIQPIDTQFE